jgi:hypothetical protein
MTHTKDEASVKELQRYSPDGEGGMELDSLGAYIKLQDVAAPPAQPAPVEPVACVACEGNPKWGNIPCAVCGTTSPAAQRQWVGLTDDEIDLFINGRGDEDDDDYVEPTGDGFGLTDADLVKLVRRSEAKLKEKNT